MLMHMLYNVDVLITAHGFQSMLLLFLPLPAILFEIFPYKYFKRGYGPFGHEYGTYVIYMYTMYIYDKYNKKHSIDTYLYLMLLIVVHQRYISVVYIFIINEYIYIMYMD